MTVELSLCKEPSWLENCENVWKKHEACFASWLNDAMVVIGAREKSRMITLGEGVKVTADAPFNRLMPGENGRLTVAAKGGVMGRSGGACVMNVACESGMEASLAGMAPDGVIGERTESDGSLSWLIYTLKTEVDEALNIGIRSTDGLNDNDHIVSLVALTAEGEHLMFRRQILLAEKRSFMWQLLEGWDFISSPVKGETLSVGGNCLVVDWNGRRYNMERELRVDDFTPCKAFWVYSPKKQVMTIDGRMGLGGPMLRPGWNAVGSLYCRKADGECFAVEGQSTVFSSWMLPGAGYWIFVR